MNRSYEAIAIGDRKFHAVVTKNAYQQYRPNEDIVKRKLTGLVWTGIPIYEASPLL